MKLNLSCVVVRFSAELPVIYISKDFHLYSDSRMFPVCYGFFVLLFIGDFRASTVKQ
jgi:hypothetical protein